MKKTLGLLFLLTNLVVAQPALSKGVIDQDQSEDSYSGCSLGCAFDWSLTSSSELTASAKSNYAAGQMEDANFQTCWAEGRSDDGVGEYLEFHLKKDPRTKGIPFSGFAIKNGYTKSDSLWAANSRVKEFDLTINGEEKGVLKLEDTSKSQFVSLANLTVSHDDVIRLTIRSVYPGSKYRDTCISELLLFGAH